MAKKATPIELSFNLKDNLEAIATKLVQNTFWCMVEAISNLEVNRERRQPMGHIIQDAIWIVIFMETLTNILMP